MSAVASTAPRGKVVAACRARQAAQAKQCGPVGVAPLVGHQRRVGVGGGDVADRLVVKLDREGLARMLAAPEGLRRLDIIYGRQGIGCLRALRAAVGEEVHGLRKTRGYNRLLDLGAAIKAELAGLWRLRRRGIEGSDGSRQRPVRDARPRAHAIWRRAV